MGEVLHGGATTTEAIRGAIQNSRKSVSKPSRRYGITRKTVAKWKRRTSTAASRPGPQEPRSTVPPVEEETIMVVSAATRSRLRTIALTPSSQQSRARAVGSHIDACGVTASADYPMSMATGQRTRHASAIGLAIATSTLPKRARPKASSTSPSRSIAQPNSPASRLLAKRDRLRRPLLGSRTLNNRKSTHPGWMAERLPWDHFIRFGCDHVKR